MAEVKNGFGNKAVESRRLDGGSEDWTPEIKLSEAGDWKAAVKTGIPK
jgi:hypothetical protein